MSLQLLVENPAYKGSLSKCLEASGLPLESRSASFFTVKWYRAQMRGWAIHYRRRFEYSAFLPKNETPERLAKNGLFFAAHYRDSAKELLARLSGGAK